MADLTCPFCGEPVPESAPLCLTCGGPLLTAAPRGPAPVWVQGPVGDAETAVGPLPAGRENCPKCGADVPDPGNLVCVECLEPLGREPERAEPVMGTRRDTAPALRLEFPGGRVTVPAGGSVVLGRDPAISDHAQVFTRFENVSRLHATVAVDPGGTCWVRDENSTNGTFVNGSRAGAGARIPLRAGDRLRLAADVEARVELDEDGHG
ncbi:hypothetical protein Aph01nite_64440 [Acrocarpospora phusangensis]|uniref:FHA domain-containing protein n=1 Tax=Acrocarpospora phusangensis TaxID=1070424 RepID=A0A919QHL2_9ACTN|nr:FHA domain-containing protein [Acrocarpospora phusangensis]GIH28134.1 hypothetical protein Aph01nite_64440 [Acrocarpospora phusangensis]